MLAETSSASERPKNRRRILRALVPVAGIAAVGLTLAACGSSGSQSPSTVTQTAGSGSTAPGDNSQGAGSTAPSSTAPAKKVVKITTLNSDGAEYGVGMPVITFFKAKITDAKAWQADTKVTANGQPLQAAWYFEGTSSGNGYYEAHLRPGPTNFWPAHAKIHVQFPAAGTSLGGNFVSDGKLSSLDFTTGPRNITVVDNSTHKVTVTSDGKVKYTYPTSLGASNTPTKSGIKVIMEKGRDISMRGPGYYDASVKFTQRLTYDGEYLHSAPWNISNIDNGVNSSNGCTNLTPSNAETLYGFLRVGDVVKYPNATGPRMTLGEGYGDYNLSWSQWQTGGAVPTH